MTIPKSLLLAFILFLSFATASSAAESQVQPEVSEPKGQRLLLLPFPFFNDTIGAGLGVAMVAEGYIQPQMLAVGSLLGSTDGNYLGYMMIRNYQLPWWRRVILDPQISYGKYHDIKSFTQNAPGFANETPGNNDSSKDNYIKADGTDFWLDFKMKYILPIGHGKEAVFPKVTLDKGLFVSGDTGGDVWNPLESGRTYVEINPFFRSQKLEGTLKTTQQTSGLDIALQYDNTNYRNNPTQGSYQRLFYSLDPGINGSNNPWQVLGFEAAKYIPLGPAWSARERVLAFNLWTVDCLSWNDFDVEGGQPVYHRPPSYKGANLGGLWRMKGFAATRFHDRAALYYGAEYRHTLDWNPLSDITFNGRLKVDWFQVVGFTELGRVAPSWSVETLHKDMKWTAGIGLRAMANNITVRADLGVSEEDHIIQLFIGYPF